MRNFRGNRRDSGNELKHFLDHGPPNSRPPIRLDRRIVKNIDRMIEFAKKAEVGTDNYNMAKDAADEIKAAFDSRKHHPKILEKIMEMHKLFYPEEV